MDDQAVVSDIDFRLFIQIPYYPGASKLVRRAVQGFEKSHDAKYLWEVSFRGVEPGRLFPKLMISWYNAVPNLTARLKKSSPGDGGQVNGDAVDGS